MPFAADYQDSLSLPVLDQAVLHSYRNEGPLSPSITLTSASGAETTYLSPGPTAVISMPLPILPVEKDKDEDSVSEDEEYYVR